MFGIFRRPKVIVQSHWYAPLWDYQTSVETFYVALEEEIKRRKFPQVQLSRVVLREAGIMSGGREYLVGTTTCSTLARLHSGTVGITAAVAALFGAA